MNHDANERVALDNIVRYSLYQGDPIETSDTPSDTSIIDTLSDKAYHSQFLCWYSRLVRYA